MGDDIRISFFGKHAENYIPYWFSCTFEPEEEISNNYYICVRLCDKEDMMSRRGRLNARTEYLWFHEPWFTFRKSTGELIGSQGKILCALPITDSYPEVEFKGNVD